MVIREMSNEECVRMLAGVRLARLACAFNNQPYVVPVYLAYHESSVDEACFYGYTTLGQKIEWMRANPLVCVEVDEVVSCMRWLSVIAYGRFKELPNLVERNVGHPPARHVNGDRYEIVADESAPTTETLLAYHLLQTHAMWWEPASTARGALPHQNAVQLFTPLYYKISIDSVTGREATPDSGDSGSFITPTSHVRRFGWLRTALTRICRVNRAHAGSVN